MLARLFMRLRHASSFAQGCAATIPLSFISLLLSSIQLQLYVYYFFFVNSFRSHRVC
jgi:hypothetical protein